MFILAPRFAPAAYIVQYQYGPSEDQNQLGTYRYGGTAVDSFHKTSPEFQQASMAGDTYYSHQD